MMTQGQRGGSGQKKTCLCVCEKETVKVLIPQWLRHNEGLFKKKKSGCCPYGDELFIEMIKFS